jgi:AraC-like DNA-binding protein
MERLAWRAPAAEADVVSSLLNRLRWTVTGFSRHELTPGSEQWFRGTEARFHHVVTGEASIRGVGGTVRLLPDDVVLAFRGGEYTVHAEAGTVLLSASMEPLGALDPALVRLPEFLLSCGFAGKEPLACTLLARIEAELAEARPGAPSVVSQLATMVASTALRAWVESGCDVEARHRAATDPDIARVTAAIRENPGQAWSLERLARLAHASRSSFAERFRLVVGESPARYVVRIRMERAKQLLSRDGLPVAQVAVRLGYASEAAFSRAFRRVAGRPPGAWRQAGEQRTRAGEQRERVGE